MIRIEPDAWRAMVAHAQKTYPNECCGAMIGALDGDSKIVREAMVLENAFEGAQAVDSIANGRSRRQGYVVGGHAAGSGLLVEGQKLRDLLAFLRFHLLKNFF